MDRHKVIRRDLLFPSHVVVVGGSSQGDSDDGEVGIPRPVNPEEAVASIPAHTKSPYRNNGKSPAHNRQVWGGKFTRVLSTLKKG